MARDDFNVTDLSILAALTAVVGGVASVVLGTVLGAVTGAIGFAAIVGGLAAFVLLGLVAVKTDLDKATLFEIVMLLVLTGVVGTAVTTMVPAASAWILNTGGGITINGLAWSLVYIGTALFVKDMFL